MAFEAPFVLRVLPGRHPLARPSRNGIACGSASRQAKPTSAVPNQALRQTKRHAVKSNRRAAGPTKPRSFRRAAAPSRTCSPAHALSACPPFC